MEISHSEIVTHFRVFEQKLDTIIAMLSTLNESKHPIEVAPSVEETFCKKCKRLKPTSDFKKGNKVMLSCFECRSAYMSSKAVTNTPTDVSAVRA
jgi:RNase P subunit RPR2